MFLIKEIKILKKLQQHIHKLYQFNFMYIICYLLIFLLKINFLKIKKFIIKIYYFNILFKIIIKNSL